MTADSARRSIGMRRVRATVPLPTGVAWAATASANRFATSSYRPAKLRNTMIAVRKSSTYSDCFCARRFASAARRFAYAFVERSTSKSAFTLAMRSAGAHTPREKVRRPFFSWTVQLGPLALTRRVTPASPGGNNSQPLGTFKTWPSSVLTNRTFGPGLTILDFVGILSWQMIGRGYKTRFAPKYKAELRNSQDGVASWCFVVDALSGGAGCLGHEWNKRKFASHLG